MIGSALLEVIEEAVALHLRASALTEEVHGASELTRACRGVLRDLDRLGPRTVPQLARRRPVSRQNIQMQVNRLIGQGMAELLPNPDHARSHLVQLTPAGKEAVQAMWRREAELADRARPACSVEQMREAAATLREVRRALEARPAEVTA